MSELLLIDEEIENDLTCFLGAHWIQTAEDVKLIVPEIMTIFKKYEAGAVKTEQERIFQEIEHTFPWIWQGTNSKPWQSLKETK